MGSSRPRWVDRAARLTALSNANPDHRGRGRMSQPQRGSFAFVSLGCPKNLVDSERMLGKLAQAGYQLTPDADGADVVIVNTCGFIEPARQESLGVIREMLDLKQQGKVGAVGVAGWPPGPQKRGPPPGGPGGRPTLGVFRPQAQRPAGH